MALFEEELLLPNLFVYLPNTEWSSPKSLKEIGRISTCDLTLAYILLFLTSSPRNIFTHVYTVIGF